MQDIRRIGTCLLLASGALLAPYAVAAPEPIVKPIMTKELGNIPGKEVLMLKVDYPPGAAEPIHHHDAHAFVYVIEGSIVMGVKDGKEVTLTPGQTFYEGPQDVHTVGRNSSKTKPAKFVVWLVKEKDVPFYILNK